MRLRFQKLPVPGLVVFSIAFCLLFGGIAFGVIKIFKGPEGTIEYQDRTT